LSPQLAWSNPLDELLQTIEKSGGFSADFSYNGVAGIPSDSGTVQYHCQKGWLVFFKVAGIPLHYVNDDKGTRFLLTKEKKQIFLPEFLQDKSRFGKLPAVMDQLKNYCASLSKKYDVIQQFSGPKKYLFRWSNVKKQNCQLLIDLPDKTASLTGVTQTGRPVFTVKFTKIRLIDSKWQSPKGEFKDMRLFSPRTK
jgi:hypothetical protein